MYLTQPYAMGSMDRRERRFSAYSVGNRTAIQRRSRLSAVPVCTALARRLSLSSMRCQQGVGDAGQPLAVCRLPASSLGNRRHDFSGQSFAADHVVSGDVVHHQPEERRQRLGAAARFGIGQLPDGLGTAAQIAAGDGPAGAGPLERHRGSGRSLLGSRGIGAFGGDNRCAKPC